MVRCNSGRGEGIPFFTYENVPGVQDLLFEGEIIEGFKELFPRYHIWVGVLKAADVVSPLTEAQCATTKANLWITGANKKWFDEPIDLTPDKKWTSRRTAKDVIDTDSGRRETYLTMPDLDKKHCVMQNEMRGKYFQVAEVAERPPGMGTAGFASRVVDPCKGLLPTYTASSRGCLLYTSPSPRDRG